MTLTIQSPLCALFLLVLVLPLLRPIPTDAATKGKYLVYVGTYTNHGSKGLYAFRFDARMGQATVLGVAAESADPVFFTVDASGHFLYAVNEISTYEGQPTGAVTSMKRTPASARILGTWPVSSGALSSARIRC